MANTSNHGWEIPDVGGDKDVWGQILNDFFDGELDEQVKLEGTFANRPSAGQDTVKYYHATDQRIVYYNDGSSWEAVYGLGTDSNPVPGTSHFEAVNTDELSTTETSDPINPNIWYGSGAIERRETNAVPVTADNTAQNILDVNEGALVLVYAYPDGSVLDGFTDVVHRLRTNATVINGEGTQTRGYSVSAGYLKLSIDDNSESYLVDAVSIGVE